MRRLGLSLVLAVLALPLSGCLSASVRDWVGDRYPLVRGTSRPGSSAEYRSPRSPVETAKEIAEARRPGERRVTPAGVFLRYDGDYVAVVPGARGGSRILIDDERRGYGHFFPYVGGYWGSYSGPAESFRGGGPGGGK